MLPVLRDHIQTEEKSIQMLMPCLPQAFTVRNPSHLFTYEGLINIRFEKQDEY